MRTGLADSRRYIATKWRKLNGGLYISNHGVLPFGYEVSSEAYNSRTMQTATGRRHFRHLTDFYCQFRMNCTYISLLSAWKMSTPHTVLTVSAVYDSLFTKTRRNKVNQNKIRESPRKKAFPSESFTSERRYFIGVFEAILMKTFRCGVYA